MQIWVQSSQVQSKWFIKFQAAGTPPGRDQVTGDIITTEDKPPKRKEVHSSFIPAVQELHTVSSREKRPLQDVCVQRSGGSIIKHHTYSIYSETIRILFIFCFLSLHGESFSLGTIAIYKLIQKTPG